MLVDLFDFDLPPERIALRPASPRDSARLLVVRPPSAFDDRVVRDLPSLLRAGDLLVVNDTKVIPAELHGRRLRDAGAAEVSLTLIRDLGSGSWETLARPAKRLKPGDRLVFGEGPAALAGEILSNEGEGRVIVAFDRSGPELREALAVIGHMPLPPYIAARRGEDDSDRTDYQTVFAKAEGAVAAPTAGLHFTPELFARLGAAGIRRATVTLHVGPGTFLPVKAADTTGHHMHSETGSISEEAAAAINETRRNSGRIVGVGTTVTRLLESATSPDGTVRAFDGATDIFITPGYRFRAIDVMMTNFHLPRSTLFMLVSAFAGRETMLAAYRHAIGSGYRFYSYGDACLLHPATGEPDGR
jgi:S-adenosylmethionine:tRNA ribosyltransferase-isomerase